MTPTTHATARSPFGAPAGLSRESAQRNHRLAVRRAEWLSCKCAGLGMVASENTVKAPLQGLATVGDIR